MSEQNKIEELLKPRYKVIADWPYSHNEVGEILYAAQRTGGEYQYDIDSGGDKPDYFTESELNQYPHLFKKLEWYEERQESELPEYLRFRTQYADKIIKVDRIANGSYGQPSVISGKYCYDLDKCTFATKEEFNNQKVKQ